jgi:hypothetical protein
MASTSPVDQKVPIVSKDLDTAFQIYGRYSSQVDTLRGWSLTLLLAYLGFLISIKPGSVSVLFPFVVVMSLFAYLEGRYRSYQSFPGKEVREVEAIFMETDHTKFVDMIRQYEFRDLRMHKRRMGRIERIINASKFMLSLEVVTWYSLLFTLLIVAYVAIHSRLL